MPIVWLDNDREGASRSSRSVLVEASLRAPTPWRALASLPALHVDCDLSLFLLPSKLLAPTDVMLHADRDLNAITLARIKYSYIYDAQFGKRLQIVGEATANERNATRPTHSFDATHSTRLFSSFEKASRASLTSPRVCGRASFSHSRNCTANILQPSRSCNLPSSTANAFNAVRHVINGFRPHSEPFALGSTRLPRKSRLQCTARAWRLYKYEL